MNSKIVDDESENKKKREEDSLSAGTNFSWKRSVGAPCILCLNNFSPKSEKKTPKVDKEEEKKDLLRTA